MFCKYCGNRLEDGDRFCGACGHPVEEKPMQETANEDSYKKQEEKVPHIKKKKPEPEYDNRMTEDSVMISPPPSRLSMQKSRPI